MPARRSDAERNRDAILGAAREAFADPEADVSMAEVARRAGVGSATLYRNFPSRQALLEALYVGEIDALCETAAPDPERPGAALEAWLRRFSAYFAAKRVVATELLRQTDAEDPFFDAGYTRVVTAGRPLLDAAQAAGEARADVTLEQVLDAVAAIAKIPGDDAYREPILRSVLAGFAASG